MIARVDTGKFELFENSSVLNPEFFCIRVELLISPNRDRQPILKLHMKHNAIHIYRMIPRTMHFYVICVRKRHKKPPKTDWLYQKAEEAKLSWQHPIDIKHPCFYAKFEASLSIQLTRKVMSKNRGTFFKRGMLQTEPPGQN
jgi:hypothetical protein